MVAVLIHPSGGAARGKVNWAKTLGQSVDFMTGDRSQLLTPEQREELLALHPDGRARFWGTFDEAWREDYLKKTGTGSAVVFTASNHVRGIGVIGAVIKNAAFADTLWAPDAEKGSYAFVYSIVGFEDVMIPYAEARLMLGKGPDYPFRSLAVATDLEAEFFGDAVAEGANLPSVPGVGSALGSAPTGASAPTKTTVTTQRIVRDGAVARWVKDLHGDQCQICGIVLAVPKGRYSEGAHIRALGGVHAGPDTPSNLLCLCPNDHVLFDAGALYLEDGNIYRTEGREYVGPLRADPRHVIDWAHATYHRENFAGIQ